jgi:hypothetical protein
MPGFHFMIFTSLLISECTRPTDLFVKETMRTPSRPTSATWQRQPVPHKFNIAAERSWAHPQTARSTPKLADILSTSPAAKVSPVDGASVSIFRQLMAEFETSRHSFKSLSAAVEATLAAAKSATLQLPGPNGVEPAVAAALLTTLSHTMTQGSTVRCLLDSLLKAIFSGIDENVAQSCTAESVVTRAFAEPVAGKVVFGELLAQAKKECEHVAAQSAAVEKTLKNYSRTITRLTEEKTEKLLRGTFTAWRRLLQGKKHFEQHYSRLFTLQSNRSLKAIYFYQWVAVSHSDKEIRTTSISAQANAALSQRLNELSYRVVAREEHIVTHRTAKEKLTTRCERLEELLALEKEELARTQAERHECDAELRRFRLLVSSALKLVVRATNVIPLLSIGLIEEIKKPGKPTINRVAAACDPEALSFRNLVSMTVPYNSKPSGTAFGEGFVEDVYLCMVRWINVAMSEAKTFIEAQRRRKSAALQTAAGDDALARLETEASLAVSSVTHLSSSLADGLVYSILLWRIAAHRFGDHKKVNSELAPFPLLDNNVDRCAFVIRVAKFLGVDGGLQPESIMRSDEESLRTHFLFCSRIMDVHGTITSRHRGIPELEDVFAEPLTSTLATTIVQSLSDQLEVLDRWEKVRKCVANYSLAIACGTLDVSALISAAARLSKPVVSTESLRDYLPAHCIVFSKENAYAAAAAAGRRMSMTHDQAAMTFFVEEVNNILSSESQLLREARLAYASMVATDAVELVLDTPTWFKFVSDIKVAGMKNVQRSAIDAIFRSIASATNPNATAVKLSTVAAASAPPEKESQASCYHAPIAKLDLAIVRIFIAKSQSQWKDVDHGVELFRDFFKNDVVPNLPRSPVDSWLAMFNSSPVQAVLRQYKDTVRRIFNELSVTDITTQLNRITMDEFVVFCTRDIKLLADPVEAQQLYHTARICSSHLSPLRGSFQLSGIDYTGFTVAVLVLSKTKYGLPLLPHHVALQNFLLVIMFPLYQFRMKLKW